MAKHLQSLSVAMTSEMAAATDSPVVTTEAEGSQIHLATNFATDTSQKLVSNRPHPVRDDRLRTIGDEWSIQMRTGQSRMAGSQTKVVHTSDKVQTSVVSVADCSRKQSLCVTSSHQLKCADQSHKLDQVRLEGTKRFSATAERSLCSE